MNPFGWVEKLFHIRTLVLFSLFIQLILIALARRRKSSRRIWIRIIVWVTFLLADSMAIYSLGKLSDAAGKYNAYEDGDEGIPDKALMMLWAPLLLLHLGGPDTITAYSIEDVRLWTRRLFSVISYAAVVLYILVKSWSGAPFWISMLTVPLFIAGVVKYAERSWVLWRSNKIFPRPQLPISFFSNEELQALTNIDLNDAKMVSLSYCTLQALAPYFLNLEDVDPQRIPSEIVQFIWPTSSERKSEETCLKFFEIQMGFMYDVLYTKANTIYTMIGFLVRVVGSLLVFVGFVGFELIAKDGYSPKDVYITHVLLGGAVSLEAMGIVQVIFSDLGIVWMTKHSGKPLVRFILRYIAPIILYFEKRCSSSLPQLNLIRLAMYKEKPAWLHRILKSVNKDEDFKFFRCRKDEDDLEVMKKLLMDKVKELLLKFYAKWDNWHEFFHKSGQHTLGNHGVEEGELLYRSIEKQNLNRRILIWHIATNCCYYHDTKEEENNPSRKASKLISDYMMYLLLERPEMLEGNNKRIATAAKSCDLGLLLSCYAHLMTRYSEVEFSRGILNEEPDTCCARDNSATTEAALSVLYAKLTYDACDVAKTLLYEDKYKGVKWEIMSGVWAEILFNAAEKIPLVVHLQQLRRGGEFITQVWLLLCTHGLVDPTPRDHLRPLFKSRIDELA